MTHSNTTPDQTPEQTSRPLFVGIDVSKLKLDVALQEKESPDRPELARYANDAQGHQALLSSLKNLPVTLVCLEATGGCERRLVEALHQAGLPVAVVNPGRIREFAKCLGQLAKTDELDAAVIVKYAWKIGPRTTPAPQPAEVKLKDLRARRQQVIGCLQAEKNRLNTAADKDVQRLIRKMVRAYEKQLQTLDAQLQQVIAESEPLRQKAELLETIPGVGPATAAMVLSEVPEMGSLTRQEVSRLAGVAPTNRDSGQSRGKRMIGGGRKAVRRALWMPALVASRRNPALKKFYDRLLLKKKPRKAALIAVMRKLLILMNTILKTQTPWKNLAENA